MADFVLTQTDAQVQSVLNDAQDAQGAGAQTTLTTEYVMLKDTEGRYHKILKSSLTEACRNVLASLLVNNDKGTTISQIAAIASGDFGSVTPANLASVLGGIFPGVVVTKNKNSTTDLNNFSLGCTITILPNVSEVPNGVDIGQAGFCISFSWSSNRCLQVIIVNDATKQIYVRSYRDDSGWTSWK